MSYILLLAIVCVFGAHMGPVSAVAKPVTFTRTTSSPDGSVSTSIRMSVSGNGRVSGSASAGSVSSGGTSTSTGFTFSADAVSSGIDVPSSPGDANSPNDAIDDEPDGAELMRNDLKPTTTLTRACGCKDSAEIVTADIRDISDKWMSRGKAKNTHGLTNMLWAWGQFVDHDVVATIDDLDGPSYTVDVKHKGRKGTMTLHRLVASPDSDGCPVPKSIHTPRIDASHVYGTDEKYLQNTLREPKSCRLRTSESNMLPITTKADAKGRFFFLAGDPRIDEHAMLTSMHTLWMREHNRLCDELAGSSRNKFMTADEQFNLVRKVVGAKVQQITMNEFLPALGISYMDVRRSPSKSFGPGITVEFATAAYRLGHDFVPDKIGSFKTKDIFNGQDFFLEHKDGGYAMRRDADKRLKKLLTAGAKNLCAERDGRLSDTLRNTLFGDFGEDLAGRNIFRGRDMAMVSYADIATCYGAKPEKKLAKKMDVSFVALLKEESKGSVLPPTLRKILVTQFHEIFFGNKGGWWRSSGDGYSGFLHEIATTTLGKVIKENTGADVSTDVFHI